MKSGRLISGPRSTHQALLARVTVLTPISGSWRGELRDLEPWGSHPPCPKLINPGIQEPGPCGRDIAQEGIWDRWPVHHLASPDPS